MSDRLKASIITLHRVKNYGSVLQAYATQCLLEDLGFQAEIVDYISPRLQDRNARRLLTQSSSKADSALKKFIHRLVVFPSYAAQKRVFNSFVEKKLRLSAPYLTEDRLKMFPPQSDLYCTGSDQVFNSQINGMVERPFFLDFAPEGRKKIAYAASFGIEELPADEEEETARLLKKYSCVSVREDSALPILEKLGVQGQTVLDPVLCVSPERLKALGAGRPRRRPYILIYELNGESRIADYAAQVSALTGWEIVRISYYYHHIFKKGHTVVCPSVGRFITLFANAALVMTDSFHGTALSLQFRKQFRVVMPPKYSTRIGSILSALDLKERIIGPDFDPERAVEETIDYARVTPALETLREDSMAFLCRAARMERTQRRGGPSCTGCGLCAALCPGGAIEMREDDSGFRYPAVVENRCLHCAQCAICRMEAYATREAAGAPACLAAVSRERELTGECSSGGVFGAAAKHWMAGGGVVYGCAFDDRMRAAHIRVDSAAELPRLFGSKYVQSDISHCFESIAADLAEGRSVLFCGTPCQTAAVRCRFKDCDRLLLIDILCHGVPSQRMFSSYLQSLSRPDQTCAAYSFRDKRLGWGRGISYTLAGADGGRKRVLRYSGADGYYAMFYEGLILRPSCYECRYKGSPRVGDITLGDFWGVEEEYPAFESGRGVSLVLVNTEKGSKLMADISDGLRTMPAGLAAAARHNTTLTGNAPRPESGEECVRLLREKGFSAAEKWYWHSRRGRRRKAAVKSAILRLKRLAARDFSGQ